ncbi:sigma-70 family RNA polymerase sigma factor [Mucilaginibacter limnophilus]|uniref:Sigma-70 family RNA polymerase sigma factor n=1 Tax=Mucilaginibacter limnophilus TaxID=1932778 RepID=A0A3S2VL88_9SPHI|nr:sigma factor-like helix-turn-helix DNA-binding protein [Mucilaginibacter limnophilus]RVT99845.1 sigma-70 family RNA polymerase sigma factor [Mucilaginibacter limnophilus]
MDTRLQYLSADTPQHRVKAIQALYERYAGMLFGYILDVVKDEKLAEQYLAETFSSIPLQENEFFTSDGNEYCKLQNLARTALSSFYNSNKNDSTENGSPKRPNSFLKLMTATQRQVFCGLYYCGKTTSGLAAELNITSTEVRKLLKEAFTIVRNNSGNATGVH